MDYTKYVDEQYKDAICTSLLAEGDHDDQVFKQYTLKIMLDGYPLDLMLILTAKAIPLTSCVRGLMLALEGSVNCPNHGKCECELPEDECLAIKKSDEYLARYSSYIEPFTDDITMQFAVKRLDLNNQPLKLDKGTDLVEVCKTIHAVSFSMGYTLGMRVKNE
jgi:hypothetical protein